MHLAPTADFTTREFHAPTADFTVTFMHFTTREFHAPTADGLLKHTRFPMICPSVTVEDTYLAQNRCSVTFMHLAISFALMHFRVADHEIGSG
jgi:hypothetical protein